MANIFDLMEEYCAANNGTNAALKTAKGAVSWGIKTGLVTKPSPSKGTDYNWQLSRRIKRNEADRQRTIKKLQRLLGQ